MSRARALTSILFVVLALAGLLWVPATAASPPPGTIDGPLAISANDNYDSGWVAVPKGTCKPFAHNLGGDPNDYAVELSFLDEANAGLGIHRRGYGGLDLPGGKQGAHWQRLTATSIQVCRAANSPFIGRVRVRVWIPGHSLTKWDSGWQSISPGTERHLTHGLDVPATDLAVSLWFRDTSAGPGNIGIHQLGYGGLSVNALAERRGAFWRGLTDKRIIVTREHNDTAVDQVRVVVYQAGPADYDSLVALGGWKALAKGVPFTFHHNLNWDKNRLLVRFECNSPYGKIRYWLAGGNRDWALGLQGANMQRLADNAVQVERWLDDDICPQARVRVWRRMTQVYLPLVVLNDG